jgi:hypothetical protein
VIPRGNVNLRIHGKTCFVQRDDECCLVNRLKKTVAQLVVDCIKDTDDPLALDAYNHSGPHGSVLA